MPVLCSLNAKSNNDKRPLLSGKLLILVLVWVEELSDMVQDSPFPSLPISLGILQSPAPSHEESAFHSKISNVSLKDLIKAL